MVDGEPVLFEILDTCPKVSRSYEILKQNKKEKCAFDTLQSNERRFGTGLRKENKWSQQKCPLTLKNCGKLRHLDISPHFYQFILHPLVMYEF